MINLELTICNDILGELTLMMCRQIQQLYKSGLNLDIIYTNNQQNKTPKLVITKKENDKMIITGFVTKYEIIKFLNE